MADVLFPLCYSEITSHMCVCRYTQRYSFISVTSSAGELLTRTHLFTNERLWWTCSGGVEWSLQGTSGEEEGEHVMPHNKKTERSWLWKRDHTAVLSPPPPPLSWQRAELSVSFPCALCGCGNSTSLAHNSVVWPGGISNSLSDVQRGSTCRRCYSQNNPKRHRGGPSQNAQWILYERENYQFVSNVLKREWCGHIWRMRLLGNVIVLYCLLPKIIA